MWLAPEVGIVKYRGDQEVRDYDTGELRGHYRYEMELIDFQ